jgi:hypothetical protein
VALGALALCLAVACGGSDGAGGGGAGGDGGNAGPLVNNTKWVPTEDDEDVLGPRPADAECNLEPIDCEEFYPPPEDDCVVLAGSSCVTAYVPECLDSFTVLAVYTRMPNPAETLCNWLTLEQLSLRDIRAGDEVEIRMRHSALNAPQPGEARMVFAVGGELALEYEVLIPSNFEFPSTIWTAPRDYPAGTRLLFHVDNHGSNEYMLIEANVL